MASPDKKALLLRIEPALYTALQRWANDETRSLNGHVTHLLSESLRHAGRKPAKAAAFEEERAPQDCSQDDAHPEGAL